MHTVQLNEPAFLVCKNCQEFIKSIYGSPSVKSEKFPDDWSFIQLGTTGKYQNESFKVIGRVRMQLRNDYKNFWSAEYKNGNQLWIVESFGSFTVFAGHWQNYNGDYKRLRAGAKIDVGASKNLHGEYVEKCEAIQYAGEFGDWKSFHPKFFVVQAGLANACALFVIKSDDDIHFLFGEKVTVEQLQLSIILQWDEWK